MNRPSLDRFARRVKTGGLLVSNSSLIDITSDRDDIEIHEVPCNEIALEEGTGKAANMVALGAYVGRTGAVRLETVLRLVRDAFAHKPSVVDVNLKTLERGFELGKKARGETQ
jgi:2-oxoglutarate ferredoxin oxidoreductase subunit gamma